MKKVFVFVLIMCLITCCITVSYYLSNSNEEITVVLYPNETNTGTHHFKVKPEGKMIIEIDNFQGISSNELFLSEEQLSVLYTLADEIQSQKHTSLPLANDAMHVKIEYNDLVLEQEFSKMFPLVKRLVSELVKIYPVKFGNYVITSEQSGELSLSMQKE